LCWSASPHSGSVFPHGRSPPRSTPARRWRQASCRYAVAVDDDARPTRQQISDAVDPAGWCLVLGAIYTEVPAPSLVEATEAASLAVSAVGADGQGHLTVDIRSDRAVLRLQSAHVPGVTGRDVRLAYDVSGALGSQGREGGAGGGQGA